MPNMMNPTPPGTTMPARTKSSPNILEWLLVVLMLATLAGVGYLYLTLTKLNGSVMSAKSDVMAMKTELMAQKQAMEEKQAMEGEEERVMMEADFYRMIAESPDGLVQLLGKGVCSGIYSVSGATSVEEGYAAQYELGYREAVDVPEEQDLGMIIVSHEDGGYNAWILSTFPGCSVTARVPESARISQ